MRATTVAAAAVILGSASAEWESWSNSTSTDPVTSKTPVLDTTTSTGAASTWSAWDPSSTVSDTTPVKDTSTSSSTSSADPSHWSEWDTSTSSTPAVQTSTSTDPASTWSEWESASSTSSTSSTPVINTSTDPHTWSEWASASSSADPTTTSSSTPATVTSKTTEDPDHSWTVWDSTKTITSTSTNWVTVTVFAVDGDEGHTWSEWTSEATGTFTETNTVFISNTVTKTATDVKDPGSTGVKDISSVSSSVSSSSVASLTTTTTTTTTSDGETWSAWPSVATPVAAIDPSCKLEISVSYGAPVWYPTPVIAASEDPLTWNEWDSTPAVSTSTDPATWSEWTSSSTPAVSTSTDPATWSEWTSSTSSTPAVSTSTDPATWSEWTSSSSTPAVSTSTDPTTWSEWTSSTSSTPVVSTSTNSVTSTESESSASSTPVVKTSTDPASTSTKSGSITQTEGGSFYTTPATDDSSSSDSGSWSQGGSGISANGNKFGMTYSPYTASSECKDQGTVSFDIAQIASKGFTSVRVYSTDCSTLEFVGDAAREHGIKVILGVFISETGISGAQPQVDAIAKWAQWDLVELIVVGNEAVFNNRCTASELAGFIGSAKQTFRDAGFKGAVSTTDELSIWESQGQAWCDVVDVVSANLYAFFNPNTAAEDAGDFIQRQIQDLTDVCPGKEVYVMESGWPSAGECNGKACPSPENQATAIKGIQQSSGAKVVFFSYEDEQWKQPGQFGVEQHWGCSEVFS